MFRYILVALLFATNSLFAQTQKGSWMAGGSGSFSNLVTSSRTDESINFSITPKVGLFLADNFAFGLGLNYTYSYAKGGLPYYNTYYSFSALSFARYYFGKSKFKTFLDGELGYRKIKQDVDFGGGSSGSDQKGDMVWATGLGAAYFLNDRVSIEASFRYTQTVSLAVSQSRYVQFNVGFQIFFPKKTE